MIVRKLTAAALVAILATAAFGTKPVSAGSAEAFVGGVIGGVIGGAIAAQQPRYYVRAPSRRAVRYVAVRHRHVVRSQRARASSAGATAINRSADPFAGSAKPTPVHARP